MLFHQIWLTANKSNETSKANGNKNIMYTGFEPLFLLELNWTSNNSDIKNNGTKRHKKFTVCFILQKIKQKIFISNNGEKKLKERAQQTGISYDWMQNLIIQNESHWKYQDIYKIMIIFKCMKVF